MTRRPDIHVVPVNDLREHDTSRPICWCTPRIEDEHGTLIVIHQSADGRELIERHGLQ